MELVARQYDKVFALFDERVAAAFPVGKLAENWDTILKKTGEFKSIETVRSEEKQGYQIVYVTSSFEHRRQDVIVAFDSRGRIALFRSMPTAESMEAWVQPAYAHNDKFHEREIQIGSAPWELPGTLTLPNGPGPFPAVVLVHGSGANNRDEGIGPNKMFKDLAWGLASSGIAVLRYDKRSYVHGKEMMAVPGVTVNEEVVEDARAAVALLAKQPEIQAKHIFVVGHSLGGMMAPRIAEGDPQIAGLIIMAGTTRPLEDLLVEQVRYSAGLSGKITPEGEKLIARAEKSAAEMRNPDLKPGMTVDFIGAILPASYVLDLRSYHAGETASRLKLPMLIMQGDRDYQVGAADLNGWKQALEKKSTVTFKTYPTLNHLFMPGAGPSSEAEYLKPNHMLEAAVDDIAGWIVKH